MNNRKVSLTNKQKNPVEILPDRFISVALDASQIVGGYWWDTSSRTKNGVGESKVEPLNLREKKLLELTSLLSPYCLRIGGTEADRFYYAFNKKKPLPELPEGYHYHLDIKRWKEIELFCRKVGTELMVTLNAGPGPRRDKNRWRKKNARQLIEYTEAKGHQINVWELGNEVNAYPFFMGWRNRIKPSDYARDIKRLKKTISRDSKALVAGPAMAVWPILGEVLPFLKAFLKVKPKGLDIITWHYYPQQSSRTPVKVRRAGKKTMLKSRNLDEAGRQARKIVKLKDKYAPHAILWLGETGHAQCGGEPGLSDSFYSGFWWLDQLGLMARTGQKQVIRQTLTGGDYGLLDKDNHSPLPDFWVTLLWNRYVGSHVYSLKNVNRSLRLYLHSLKENEEAFCLIYIHLGEKKSTTITISDDLPPIREVALLTSSNIYSREILLNGVPIREENLPNLPATKVIDGSHEVVIPPLSYGFLCLY